MPDANKLVSSQQKAVRTKLATPLPSGRGWEASRCAAPPGPGPSTVVPHWDKTYSCYGSRRTLTSPSVSVLRLTRTAHARFLSDTAHCPIVTANSVVRHCLKMDLDGLFYVSSGTALKVSSYGMGPSARHPSTQPNPPPHTHTHTHTHRQLRCSQGRTCGSGANDEVTLPETPSADYGGYAVSRQTLKAPMHCTRRLTSPSDSVLSLRVI